MNIILKALMVSVWFMALTFPLVVMKVDALNNAISFRWENMATIGAGAFVLSIFWRWSMERKAAAGRHPGLPFSRVPLSRSANPRPAWPASGLSPR